MSSDAANPQPTALHQALKAAALKAYGSLLSGALADRAAVAFADEASAMLEGMIADHTQVLRDRIEGQLAGMSLGKGAKRKGPAKAPAHANGTNGTNGAVEAAPVVPAEPDPVEQVEAKPAKAESRAGKSETKGRPRKKAGGRSSARA